MYDKQLLGLEITSERNGDAVVLYVHGEVDLATSSELAHHIERALTESPVAVIVDLSGVSFLASVGMSVLVSARRKACCSTALVVVASGPATTRPMHLVGLDAAVPIYTDIDSALEATNSVRSTESDPTCPDCDAGESPESAYSA
ncbi:STAS domain-containing protein [Rhodococcus sp. NPDC078407]|uniref:STAS domain-containing protein n=1 Tax=Rhodococcus sp. NPDC078407 TaxID=3364509 RepID=UPI0037CA245D